MFRFALAFLLLARSAMALPTCAAPQQVEEGGDTIMEAGDSFQEVTPVDDPNANQVWYLLTVEQLCQVQIGINSCTSNSPAVTINVFEASTYDCNMAGGGPGVNEVASATENCNLILPGDFGALVGFPHNEVGQTDYLIQVISSDGQPFDFPGSLEIRIQGGLAGACGDPHFKRWGQQQRDSFHGECDLVLFHNEIEGQDVDVHIRTTMKDAYSYVSGVAVQHGADKLEFEHDAVFLNGVKATDEEILEFGSSSKAVLVDESKRKYFVNIHDHVFVQVHSTKTFMGVAVDGVKSSMDGSRGILGEYGTGNMLSRAGDEMDDFESFGFEWQVNPEDPQIFHKAREPQLPYERCRMPSISAEARRRKLRGQDRKLYEEALVACAKNHIPENMQSCLDDVMFTGEIELAYEI